VRRPEQARCCGCPNIPNRNVPQTAEDSAGPTGRETALTERRMVHPAAAGAPRPSLVLQLVGHWAWALLTGHDDAARGGWTEVSFAKPGRWVHPKMVMVRTTPKWPLCATHLQSPDLFCERSEITKDPTGVPVLDEGVSSRHQLFPCADLCLAHERAASLSTF